MTYFRLFFIPLVLVFAAPAFANDATPERVVELFTSQGCSSCPPANKFAGDVAADPGTLVLTYGVTYWDYLGWKDTFAAPEFTARQKAYGRAFGSANVYTPQLILNGSAHSSSYSAQDVRSMNLQDERPKFSFETHNGALAVKSSENHIGKEMAAILVEYVSGPQSVSVSAGENHGRVLTLTNVVTGITQLGLWSPAQTLETKTSPQDGKSYALLLHDPDSSKLITALRYSN